MLPWLLLSIGIVVLLISTSILIRTATRLSSYLRLSPLIVGLTVVAIGTSLPELTVSTIAVINHDPGLALGNIVGSNIINILLVMAVGILMGNVKIGRFKTQRNAILLLVMTFLFPSLFLFKVPPVLIAILLLIATGCFTIAEYNWGVEGRKLEDKIQLKFTKKKVFKIMDLVLLFGSIGLLFIGGSLVVSSVEQLAIITGLSTSFFGLSITAIATSLPELFTTIISKKNKEDKLMMGNILGSNLYNIMLIGGIASLGITSFSLSLADTTIFLFTSLLGVAIIIYFKGKVVPKGIGIILLLLFFLYLLMLRNL